MTIAARDSGHPLNTGAGQEKVMAKRSTKKISPGTAARVAMSDASLIYFKKSNFSPKTKSPACNRYDLNPRT